MFQHSYKKYFFILLVKFLTLASFSNNFSALADGLFSFEKKVEIGKVVSTKGMSYVERMVFLHFYKSMKVEKEFTFIINHFELIQKWIKQTHKGEGSFIKFIEINTRFTPSFIEDFIYTLSLSVPSYAIHYTFQALLASIEPPKLNQSSLLEINVNFQNYENLLDLKGLIGLVVYSFIDHWNRDKNRSLCFASFLKAHWEEIEKQVLEYEQSNDINDKHRKAESLKNYLKKGYDYPQVIPPRLLASDALIIAAYSTAVIKDFKLFN